MLAEKVYGGGDNVVPALREALLKAGFVLRGRDGNLIQTPHGQGPPLHFWEVDVMAQLAHNGMSVPFADLARLLTKIMPEPAHLHLADQLLDDIRAQAHGSEPAPRFWANFIIELGRHASEPYDLLKPVNPNTIRFDAIQTVFVLQRLTNDLRSLANRIRRQPEAPHGAAASTMSSIFQQIEVAAGPGWLRPGVLNQPPQLAQATSPPTPSSRPTLPGCTWEGDLAPMPDEVALFFTTLSDTLRDYLEKSGMSALKKYGTFLARANIILAYTKMIWTYAAFDVDINMTNPP